VGRDSLPSLFLFLSLACALLAISSLVQKKIVPAINGAVAFAILLFAFIMIDEVPEPLTKAAPYLLTLIVLATASQRLRPPAHAGLPYRSGEGH
jgi:simple sugar transport system permease protein